MENTVPFDTWKFRKCEPEILVEWITPVVTLGNVPRQGQRKGLRRTDRYACS